MTPAGATEGGGVLAIWHDIEPTHETAVLRWYDREHHIERVSVPGFIRARRFVATSGAPKYFIYYEVSSPAVLESSPYLDRVNDPTAWTRASMPRFRNNVRTVCRVSYRSPGADGAHVATMRIAPRRGCEQQLRDALGGSLFPKALERDLFLKAQLWEADKPATTIASGERALRGARDRLADWVVVLSASSPAVLDSLLASHFHPDRLRESGALPEPAVGVYALQLTLERD